MPKSRIIPLIGLFIAFLPVLGFPHTWELIFQVLGGISIVLLSVLISIDKRLTRKAKAEKRQRALRMSVEEEVRQETQTTQDGGSQIQ